MRIDEKSVRGRLRGQKYRAAATRAPRAKTRVTTVGALRSGDLAFAVSACDATVSVAVPDVRVTPSGATGRTSQRMGYARRPIAVVRVTTSQRTRMNLGSMSQ